MNIAIATRRQTLISLQCFAVNVHVLYIRIVIDAFNVAIRNQIDHRLSKLVWHWALVIGWGERTLTSDDFDSLTFLIINLNI